MIRLRCFAQRTCEWVAIDGGFMPITADQLRAMRRRFCDEYERLLAVDAINQAPQTVVREVIRAVAPELGSFDVLALGYTVTNPRIEVDDVKWPTDKRLKALAARSP